MNSLQIQIVDGGPSYAVRLMEEDGTSTEGPLLRPDVHDSVWSPEKIAERVSNSNRNNRNSTDFQEIADTLEGWLFPPGPVRERWTAIRNESTPYLYLDTQLDEFKALPWELVSRERFAVIHGMCRSAKAKPVQWQVSSWPFRILLVVGAPAAELVSLGIEKEINAIQRDFVRFGRSIDVHRLDQPGKETLKDWVQAFQPHVLHFAGHGGRLPGAKDSGLRFDPAGAEPWIWSGSDIRIDLMTWRWVPRFVFLNACRSSVELAGTLSVQRGFLDCGTQAVLGMQADIDGELAASFAARFYDECIQGKTLEEAVFEARSAIGATLSPTQKMDWALPSLTFSTPGIRLVELPAGPDSPEFRYCREFVEARFFANCREPRRTFTHWLYPVRAATAKAKNVLLVTGESRAGKSHLLKWCMETWSLGGARVRYIELHEQSRTLLDVLRQIRKGESDGTTQSLYLHEPLKPAAFRRFRWELKNMLDKGEPGEWVEGDHVGDAEIEDDDGVLPAKGDKRLEPMICSRFLAALQGAAADEPLVLVFDRLGGPNNERTLFAPDFEKLIKELFLPISRDKSSKIKLVFVATFAEERDYKLDLLAGEGSLSYVVPVDYTEERLVELAAEAVWFDFFGGKSKNKSDIEVKAKALAMAMLSLPDDERAQGLGRLKPFIKHVDLLRDFKEVRMR